MPIDLSKTTSSTTTTMTITSSAFEEGANIPRQYTCDGAEMSPPINISEVPKGTKSLALIVEDPDAPSGTFVHWVIYNISPKTTILMEEMPNTSPTVGTGGKNSAGTTGYLGPCPPSGSHRYIFTLYAVDIKLPLPPGATKADVLHVIQGHTLAEARLMGRYKR